MPRINVSIDGSQASAGASVVRKALSSISSGASSVLSALNPMNHAISALITTASAVKMISIADEYTVMAKQLEFVTGSTYAAAEAEKELYRISQATGTSTEKNAETYVKLQQAQAMTKLSSEENLTVLGALNALMIKTGTGTAQAAAATFQLSQALVSGQLSGDEFKSMAENAPGVLLALSEAMGVPRSQLKQMAADGKLTSEVLAQAFLDISTSAAGSFENLPETAASGWQQVVNAFKEAWDQINDDTGIMSYLRQALIDLAGWIEEKTPVISQWFSEMVLNIQENWPTMQEAIQAFINLLNTAWQNIYNNLPTVGQFFSNLKYTIESVTGAIKAFTTALQWIIDNWQYVEMVANYTPAVMLARGAGTLAGGGSVGEAVSNAFDFDNSNLNAPSSSDGGSTVNVNVNQSVSRSDVVNIASESKRAASRGAL